MSWKLDDRPCGTLYSPRVAVRRTGASGCWPCHESCKVGVVDVQQENGTVVAGAKGKVLLIDDGDDIVTLWLAGRRAWLRTRMGDAGYASRAGGERGR